MRRIEISVFKKPSILKVGLHHEFTDIVCSKQWKRSDMQL